MWSCKLSRHPRPRWHSFQLTRSLPLFDAVSWHLERYYRKRREIARLYTPLDVSPDESFDEDELSELPTYRQSTGSSFSGRSPIPLITPPSGNNDNTTTSANGKPGARGWPQTGKSLRRLGDVWDSGEELFALGEEDESEEEGMKPAQRGTSPMPPR